MRRRSIRFRLTLWYSAVLALGLTLLGGFIWFAMRHRLLSDLDAGLSDRTQALEDYFRGQLAGSPRHLQSELGEFAAALPAEYRIRIAGPGDALIYATNNAQSVFHDTPGVAPAEHAQDRWLRVTARGEHYRILDRHREIDGRNYHLLVAVAIGQIDQTLRRLGFLLITAIPGVVAIAATGGYFMSARALAPVDAMTRTARSIGIRNLSQRLTLPDTGDEIQRLAETWNEMLLRLETAVTRISQFTSDASHEIRTPIALIRSTAEIAIRKPRSEGQYRESLKQIETESARMTQLVEDLLFLAREDAQAGLLKMAPVDLRTVAADACAEIAPLALTKGVDLVLSKSNDPILINGLEAGLRRMLLALLDNALKYTPADGAITVTAGRSEQEAFVAVRDTGIGVPEEALPHIFERFFRADVSRSRDSGGHGLGLSIAQAIARQHDGFITAESALAAGSEFRVTFPSRIAC